MPKAILNIIGISELQRKTPAILKTIAQSDRESLVVTHNVPQVVMMSIDRYEALKAREDLEFIPHRKTSPQAIRASFAQTGLYSNALLDDIEGGLKKSSAYSTQ